MLRKIKFFLIASFLYLAFASCSFDAKNTSGIWTGNEDQEQLIRLKNGKIVKVFKNKNDFSTEVIAKHKSQINSYTRNSSWPMSGLNLNNSTGNLEFSGSIETVLKKKVGKNNKSYSKVISSPITHDNSIILSDNNGSIFNINNSGKVIWKNNIYKKINKKIYKVLSHAFYKENVYIADNIGYLYSIDSNNGEILWIMNYGVPFRSSIKLYNDKIYLIDQNNTVLCFDALTGEEIWNLNTGNSFIKSQSFLALAISKTNHIFFINSIGEVTKVNADNGKIVWSIPIIDNLANYKTDFFKTSNIIIDNKFLIFSNSTNQIFAINSENAFFYWQKNINSTITPIVIDNNVFVLTTNGFLVNISKINGKILWSRNILKKVTKKKENIKMSGFVMGGNKIYSTTNNGYLIVTSAADGEIEIVKKVAKSINVSPIISDGKLYLLTGNSSLLVFI